MKVNFFLWLTCLLISIAMEAICQEFKIMYGLGIIVGIFLVYAMYHDDVLVKEKKK